MTSGAIFDRMEIVQLLRDTCFAEGGTSSAITCAQKSGKSYLLQHVYDSHSAQFIAGQRVIFCALNQDLLKSMTQSQPGNPDQVFLLFFCRRLQDQLEIWVEDLSRGEAQRQAEIQELTQKAVSAEGELKTALELKKDSLQLQQVELDRLRVILALLDPLALGRVAIDIPSVMKVLDKLKRMQKRIILFIDDFDRMVKVKKTEESLSDALFNFLRGASTEKKLVTLVASNVHPMDPELHDNFERPSLFNHFQVQHLAPFNSTQAAEFLASWLSKPWLARGRAPLDAEQIGYLVDLAGGCPFFLETAHLTFQMQDRPATPAKRFEFENVHIMPLLEPAFLQVWRRCSADQRSTLRELANGNPIPTTSRSVQSLVREGYIIMKGDQVQPFSRLFAKFIKSAVDDPPPRLEVKAILNYRVFPTALAVAQPAENHPLISFTLDNPTGEEIGITLECDLVKYGNKREFTSVKPRTSEPVDMRFTLQNLPASFETRWCDFCYSAWRELPNGAKTPLVYKVQQMRILPIDTFVFARRDNSGKRLIDWSWMIAAWVSKNNPGQLQTIIEKARELNGGDTRGYAVSGNVRDGVQAQVKALYEALQITTRISYDDSATVFHLNGNDFAQRVRLPSRSLKDQAANCLDGSVLFASLLATIGLHPIVLLLPRHAVVGWKQEDSDASDVEFLETTMLRKEGFSNAYREGMNRYAAVRALADRWQYTGEIPDEKEFAIPIDVEKEWTGREVVSLPWE